MKIDVKEETDDVFQSDSGGDDEEEEKEELYFPLSSSGIKHRGISTILCRFAAFRFR